MSEVEQETGEGAAQDKPVEAQATGGQTPEPDYWMVVNPRDPVTGKLTKASFEAAAQALWENLVVPTQKCLAGEDVILTDPVGRARQEGRWLPEKYR